MKVLITGATGMVGRALVKSLVDDDHTVIRLLRPGSTEHNQFPGALDVEWNPSSRHSNHSPFGAGQRVVEGADAVVNLAGASIGEKRWSTKRKALLWNSRINTTRGLVMALQGLREKPKVLVSASATGFYGSRREEVRTEDSRHGGDFLARLTVAWESEAAAAETLGMRVVRARFGVILAKHGGALPKMMEAVKIGVGKFGSGRQWISWISLDDAVRAVRLAMETESMSGPVNVVTPQPVRNLEFLQILARTMNRKTSFRAPGILLRIALGKMGRSLLLYSQRVVPTRLAQAGFRFWHPRLPEALDAELHEL